MIAKSARNGKVWGEEGRGGFIRVGERELEERREIRVPRDLLDPAFGKLMARPSYIMHTSEASRDSLSLYPFYLHIPN